VSGAAEGLPAAVPSVKGMFPFSLGCTSYLVPADIEPNILAMRSLVDEMELILFEGADFSNMPGPAEVTRFGSLARETGLRYNVHLPLDGDIASADAADAARSLEAVKRVVGLTEALKPTTWTLHLPVLPDGIGPAWRDRVGESLRRLPGPPARYSVETLAYDLRVIADIIVELGFSVCIDVGHLLVNGLPVGELFDAFAGRVTMVHLHGVRDGRDHLPLSALPEETARMVGDTIGSRAYAGSLCLEVFSMEDHARSLPALCRMFGGTPC
jgi:sugar phosphate isomerase/epimerase